MFVFPSCGAVAAASELRRWGVTAMAALTMWVVREPFRELESVSAVSAVNVVRKVVGHARVVSVLTAVVAAFARVHVAVRHNKVQARWTDIVGANGAHTANETIVAERQNVQVLQIRQG